MIKKYCVIIGDIVQSKEIKNRGLLQRKFYAALEKINKQFASQIVSKFTVTLGDEFQGVLKDLSSGYAVVNVIQEMFFPVKLRFGVGRGRIATRLRKEAMGMDGPAFHFAREAVEEAREKKREIIYHTGFKEKDAAINALLFAISVFREGRTQRQFQAVSAYRKYRTQKKASRAMGIDRTTLTKMLKAAKWDQVSELENAANAYVAYFSHN